MASENSRDPNNNDNADDRAGEWEISKSLLDHEDYWLENARGNLMVVATVLATISFQIAVNPPGGVWQDGDKSCDSLGRNCTRIPGTSVLENSDFGNKSGMFYDLFNHCIVSFSMSMAVMYVIILGVSLRNKFVEFLVSLIMGTAFGSTVEAFELSVKLVHSDNASIRSRMLIYDRFWLVIFILLPVIFGLKEYMKSRRGKKRSDRASRSSHQTTARANA